MHTLEVTRGGTRRGHDHPIRAPGYRHRGSIRESWPDEEKEGSTSHPASLTGQWRRNRLSCLQGRVPSPALLAARRIRAWALQPPGLLLSVQSCPFFRSWAFSARPALGLPGCSGSPGEGQPHPGQGSEGLGHKLRLPASPPFTQGPSCPPPADPSYQPQPTLERQRRAQDCWPLSPQRGKIRVFLGNQGWV